MPVKIAHAAAQCSCRKVLSLQPATHCMSTCTHVSTRNQHRRSPAYTELHVKILKDRVMWASRWTCVQGWQASSGLPNLACTAFIGYLAAIAEVPQCIACLTAAQHLLCLRFGCVAQVCISRLPRRCKLCHLQYHVSYNFQRFYRELATRTVSRRPMTDVIKVTSHNMSCM